MLAYWEKIVRESKVFFPSHPVEIFILDIACKSFMRVYQIAARLIHHLESNYFLLLIANRAHTIYSRIM